MRKPPENPLSFYDFGRELLRLGDLDPVYTVLWHARLDRPRLRRWLLAYWDFYHAGTASWAADQAAGYWGRMRAAAASKDYPRSPERRHFRGAAAAEAVEWQAARGRGVLFGPLVGKDVTAADLMSYVMTWRNYGPWIAFKVADMVERLGLSRVTFDAGTAMYEGSPQEAALLLYSLERPGDPPPVGKAAVRAVAHWAADRVLTELAGYEAPPSFDRPLGFAEAETVCCKAGSYRKGHYHPGEDVGSVRRGLGFVDNSTTRRLLAAGRDGGLWDA